MARPTVRSTLRSRRGLKSTCQRVKSSLFAIALSGALTACGLSVPSDPRGTLAQVNGAELRVGFSPEPGLVSDDDNDPAGPLVELIEEFATTIGAQPAWTIGSEETLVGMLEDGELDVLIGGYTDQSPWLNRAGMTRGYPEIDGAEGRRIVVLVPLGENAFLMRLETFLDEELQS